MTLLLKSWRTKTNKSYDSLFGKWHSWCSQRSFDPFSGPVANVANFLAHLYKEGYQYSSINAYRSAISSVHEQVDGHNIGQHPIITRLTKGIFNIRPPLPWYTCTWSVQAILNHIESLGDNNKMPLKHLSLLLALTRPSRSADVSQLDISRRAYKSDGVCFYPSSLAKQSRQGSQIANFFFLSFPSNLALFPVSALQAYEKRTESIRGQETRLLLATIKPYKPISSSSVAHWLKSMLEQSGIDVTIFNAHSVRSASSSNAANVGITTNDILKAANWSSESVFQRFYNKPPEDSVFGRAVFSSGCSYKPHH